MEVNKISLMDAYLIETLRTNGVSNQEILAQVETGDVKAWQEFNEKFDYTALLELAKQDAVAFRSIISDGYNIKFVTFNGLKNLLKFRFGKEKEKDYQLTETGIHQLTLNEQQLATLKQMLSRNWMIEETVTANRTIVNIELV
ncbi:hypothetical protein [Oceanobacillus bengalensis]|uniref:Uncharacterized protein n=1 Tax=Oceanobacillus bengalensis TaxID=1435466 RepID=A0A494Z7Q3_9BACI|nr:hypothetical protein [Oceanobacillus bengalensis]RKQ18615.1 hypothetical protein D8M05_00425 [Oceanobacillus bengalensis]